MPLGPTRTFKVTRGDSIDISAWAHYEEASSSSGFNFTLFITNTYDDTNSESLLGNLSLGLGFSGANGARVPDVPYAYLKYIVYRADSSIAEEGEHLISSSANSNWEELALSTVIEEDGYIKVFALNEDAVNVWFDDFSIAHKQSPIAQQTDYYPFGLEIAATQYNRDTWLENRFNRFQGQELDEQMGWVQFKWRNHQPAIGRFFNIDPLSEKYLYNSTYAFSENRVIDGVELEGLEWQPINSPDELYSTPAIDMNYAPPRTPLNSAGYPRSSAWYFRNLLKLKPEYFDKSNVNLINKGKVPIINEQWVLHHPKHAEWIGQKLVHHHINQENWAVAIPETAHKLYFSEIHPNPNGLSPELVRPNSAALRQAGLDYIKKHGKNIFGKSAVGNTNSKTSVNKSGFGGKALGVGIGLFGFAIDFGSNNPQSLNMLMEGAVAGKLNTVYYDYNRRLYYEILSSTKRKNDKGGIDTYTFLRYYSGCDWSESENKYVGTGDSQDVHTKNGERIPYM